MENEGRTSIPMSTPSRWQEDGIGCSQETLTPTWQRGDICWGKVGGYRWWPAVILDEDDLNGVPIQCRLKYRYVFWYGHNTVGSVPVAKLEGFREHFKEHFSWDATPTFLCGVQLSVIDLGIHLNMASENWSVEEALQWAEENFLLPKGCTASQSDGVLSPHVEAKLRIIRGRYEEKEKVEVSMKTKRLLQSTTALDVLCLACLVQLTPLDTSEHPLFLGRICKKCKDEFLKKNFSIGLDLVAYNCCICVKPGQLVVCCEALCHRSYCHICLATKASQNYLDQILDEDDWSCFLCQQNPEMHGLLKPRCANWRTNVWQLFHAHSFDLEEFKKVKLSILCFEDSSTIAFNVLSVLLKHNVCVETLFLCDFGSIAMKKIEQFLPIVENLKHLKCSASYGDYLNVSQLGPIHLVITSCKGTDMEVSRNFAMFYDFISTVEIVANARVRPPSAPLMWVFELPGPVSPPNYFHITRFLQFDPANWSEQVGRRRKIYSNLVWTNLPILWPNLDGKGVQV